MGHHVENLQFSGLYKLDVLVHLDIKTHTFYELGLKKFFAFSSDKELVFMYINPQGERFDKNYDWDFVDNPIYCMCFEPSGTWLLIVSEQKVLLVPFYPLFAPDNTFDCKWSLKSVTVLPLSVMPKPTSVVWWLTKESDNVLIIGSKAGDITFYSVEVQSVVSESKVSTDIRELQICFDDSLDLLTLLISGSKTQQWKLILEHRSMNYNWLQQVRSQSDKDKKDGFMSYIKQLSKDKITLFTQGGSRDDSKLTVEYVLKPIEYLPVFRKGSNNWALTAQYVNGRHFLTAFELNEGTLILESPDEDTPSRTLRPQIKKDRCYLQGLWSQRLIYLLGKNTIEIHSANFSVIQNEVLLGNKREFSELWNAELIGDVLRGYLMSAKEPPGLSGGWKEPTFLCDLQLPRFNLEPCLIVTTQGAYIFNTVCDPCEWLVGLIMRGGVGAENSAAGLGAPVPILLRSAADMLISRGKVAPAEYLYSLSQSPLDGWVARLGVFGRLHELSMCKQTGSYGSLGNAALTIKLLALLRQMAANSETILDTIKYSQWMPTANWEQKAQLISNKFLPPGRKEIRNVKLTTLTPIELAELSSTAAAIGLWDILPAFNVQRGHPNLMLSAFHDKNVMCRGAVHALLKHRCLVLFLLEENAQWFFHFITGHCSKFDSSILKLLCLWLNPLQDQLRPIMRDLKQGVTSLFTTRLLNLITTFIHVASAVEARYPCPDLCIEITPKSDTWKNNFYPKRSISCGLAHWAITENGNAKIMMTNTSLDTELIGRVTDVSCGRHHTLVLTENGIYSSGDNSYGQLGVGASWPGAIGDAATSAGSLMHVPFEWTAPVMSVSAGHYHSAAVDVGGRVYTWGWNVHGQLGLGTIEDYCTPQLVTKLQGRKVLGVGCGACHTVMLTKNGEVWACGASVFGQLGSGTREKSSLPVRVEMGVVVEKIAVGYFHNLALTTNGRLLYWGSSPQQVRATHALRSAAPDAEPCVDPHLVPQLVDTRVVKGRIVQIAAGWHQSCIVDNCGNLYTWGLNFDGQLGSGDRKQVPTPKEVKICNDARPVNNEQRTPLDVDIGQMESKAIVACGGDFTIFIDDDGRIYASGNMHLELDNPKDKDKVGSRVIMMKTSKRVIKIPASKNNNKFLFQPIYRVDVMFSGADDLRRVPIDSRPNPLNTLDDFNRKSWPDEVIYQLSQWINEDNLIGNLNMAAKLAYRKNSFSECLRLLLENLKTETREDNLYIAHSIINKETEEMGFSRKDDELKITVTNKLSKRIKDISLSILNDESYPVNNSAGYQSLPCCCDELKYLKKDISLQCVVNIERDLSIRAAYIIDRCISIFPVDAKLWEDCFCYSKNFYVKNNLPIGELENVLRKYMVSNASTMVEAILYSSDCTEYSQILSPKFYLNMCSQVMDTWS